MGEEDVRNNVVIWMQSSIHISLASATLFNGLLISIYNVNVRWLILAGTFLIRYGMKIALRLVTIYI